MFAHDLTSVILFGFDERFVLGDFARFGLVIGCHSLQFGFDQFVQVILILLNLVLNPFQFVSFVGQGQMKLVNAALNVSFFGHFESFFKDFESRFVLTGKLKLLEKFFGGNGCKQKSLARIDSRRENSK